MGGPNHTLEQVLEAVRDSNGIKQTIAKRLKVHRNSVDNYLKRWASAREAYDDEVQKIGDAAESVIIKAISREDVDTCKWYARVKLKDRGYVERQEVTGKDGAPISMIVEVKVVDDRNG